MADAPVTDDFLADVEQEAAYQAIWGGNDSQKTDDEWFWTLGWIAGKALRPDADLEKKRHRLRAAAALLMNWDKHLTSATESVTVTE